MKKGSLTEYTLYTKICRKCKNAVTVFTQKDNRPEYYTIIFVSCKCDNYLKFNLPIN